MFNFPKVAEERSKRMQLIMLKQYRGTTSSLCLHSKSIVRFDVRMILYWTGMNLLLSISQSRLPHPVEEVLRVTAAESEHSQR